MADEFTSTIAPETPDEPSVQEILGQIKSIASGIAALGVADTLSEVDRDAVGQMAEVIYELAG